MFKGLAPFQAESFAPGYASIAEAVKDPDFLLELKAAEPGDYALLHDTCSITSLEGSSKVNVIPPQASMDVDCRLLPDQDPDAFVADLRKLFVDPTIAIEKILSFKPAASPTDTVLYSLIQQVATEAFPGTVVIPTVSTGFTDSHFFRELGIVSYGTSFFVVEKDDIRRAHGNDERIGVQSLERGTTLLIEMLDRFTATE
jgi:acetylornithine deacetylase/succinyl-diaminopimelate desuccinylase-like protein